MILSHVHVSLTCSLSLPLSSSLSQINKSIFFKKAVLDYTVALFFKVRVLMVEVDVKLSKKLRAFACP